MIRAAMVEKTTRMEIKLAERDRDIEKLQDDMAWRQSEIKKMHDDNERLPAGLLQHSGS
jgi:uncharacterized coiled-coil protein SlyX